MNFGSDYRITFKEDSHQYFDSAGNEYASVSRVLSSIKKPFDRDGVSYMMAKKYCGKGSGADEIEEYRQKLLSEWDNKKDSSINRGNFIHDNLESYFKYRKIDDSLIPVVRQLKPVYDGCYKVFSEVMLHDTDYMIAGTTDFAVQRRKSRYPVIDIHDFKTNESKGIKFDSIDVKNGIIKHYDRYLLSPFDYMEDCNYVNYSLQLSSYARMAEKLYGVKIGKLSLIFIDTNLKVHIYPVPYLRLEVDLLFEHYKNLKQLPKAEYEVAEIKW